MTGASGYIGKNLTKSLKDQKTWDLKLLSGSGKNGFIKCDLTKDDLSEVVSGVDCVLHLAQSEKYRDFPECADEILSVNVLGLQRLAEASRKAGVKRFINFSSGNVYAPKDSDFIENDLLAPTDFYGQSKLMGEQVLDFYRPYFELFHIRLFCPYGPGQTDKLVPNMIQSILDGKELYFANHKGLVFNPIHINDVVELTMKILESDTLEPGAFNLGGPNNLSLFEVCESISKKLDRDLKYKNVEQTPKYFTCSNQKLKAQLNWAPKRVFVEEVSSLLEGGAS